MKGGLNTFRHKNTTGKTDFQAFIAPHYTQAKYISQGETGAVFALTASVPAVVTFSGSEVDYDVIISKKLKDELNSLQKLENEFMVDSDFESDFLEEVEIQKSIYEFGLGMFVQLCPSILFAEIVNVSDLQSVVELIPTLDPKLKVDPYCSMASIRATGHCNGTIGPNPSCIGRRRHGDPRGPNID